MKYTKSFITKLSKTFNSKILYKEKKSKILIKAAKSFIISILFCLSVHGFLFFLSLMMVPHITK